MSIWKRKMPTVGEIFDTFNQNQKDQLFPVIGTLLAMSESLNDDQKMWIMYMVNVAINE